MATLSSFEKGYLTALQDLGYACIAREPNGDLYVYDDDVGKDDDEWSPYDYNETEQIKLSKFVSSLYFKSVKWEDEEPTTLFDKEDIDENGNTICTKKAIWDWRKDAQLCRKMFWNGETGKNLLDSYNSPEHSSLKSHIAQNK